MGAMNIYGDLFTICEIKFIINKQILFKYLRLIQYLFNFLQSIKSKIFLFWDLIFWNLKNSYPNAMCCGFIFLFEIETFQVRRKTKKIPFKYYPFSGWCQFYHRWWSMIFSKDFHAWTDINLISRKIHLTISYLTLKNFVHCT